MRKLLVVLLAGLMVLGGSAVGDGTTINGSRTILGKWDASTATQTLPVKADTSLPEACTVNEMFWLTTETGGRGIYLCTATDTWQALGWSVGDTSPGTCAVGEVFFDTDATAGENILACGSTDTWTTVGIITTGYVTGSGTNGNVALWNGTDSLSYDGDIVWDGTSRLLVTDLTVSNTIDGNITGLATQALSAARLDFSGLLGQQLLYWQQCGAEYQIFFDEDGDGLVDAADYCYFNSGVDLDCDCTVDRVQFVDRGVKPQTAGGETLWSTYALNDKWVKWDVYGSAGGTAPGGGLANGVSLDSDGDGPADLFVENVVVGFEGDGTNKQQFCTFPGGYSSDPFDYTVGFCAESDSAGGQGSFYPINSDPLYGSLGSAARADLGTSTYRWRNVYTVNFNASGVLTANSATFSQFGYSNTYNGGTANFWNSYQGHSWEVDRNFDNAAQRVYSFSTYSDDDSNGTAEVRELMHLDRDATPQYWVDANGDGSYDIQFDSTMTDCDNATTSKVLWSIETGKLSCGTDQTGGGGGTTRRTIGVTVDGGSSSPATGVKGSTRLAVAGTIKKWTILADTAGSVSFGVWKDTLANYPPTVADSICASACPALSSDDAGEDSTLTGWTTAVSAGDVIRFNLDSVTTIKQATLIIEIEETL